MGESKRIFWGVFMPRSGLCFDVENENWLLIVELFHVLSLFAFWYEKKNWLGE